MILSQFEVGSWLGWLGLGTFESDFSQKCAHISAVKGRIIGH